MTSKKVIVIIILALSFIIVFNGKDKRIKEVDSMVQFRENYVQKKMSGSKSEKETRIFTTSPDSLRELVSLIGLKRKNDKNDIDSIFSKCLDSVYRAKNIFPLRFYTIADSTYVSKYFLEKNEKLAIWTVEMARWKDEISTETFKEYILPYKLGDELADNWREILCRENQDLLREKPELNNLDSLYRYHMQKTYYSLSSENLINRFYPVETNYTWLKISGEGDCSDRCRYVIYHLRAAGIPATYDYIPAWGNRPKARHAYVGLANKKQQLSKLLENRNDTGNLVENLNAANISEFRPFFARNEIPSELTVQYEKTIPKVYRRTWGPQLPMQKIMDGVLPGQLYSKLIKDDIIDVTAQYMKTAGVNIWHTPFDEWKVAYLATFDISGWTPVSFSRFSWLGMARFKDMGKNILYLPMVCRNKKLLPLGNPFILDNDGGTEKLVCNYKKKVRMKLFRKFPLFSYTAAHVVDLKGCIISGSNDSRFESTERLAVIDHYPFFMEKIRINNPNKYRFIKIESPGGKKVRLSYLSCFSDSCGNPIRYNDIRYLRGELSGQYRNLFDDDLSSFTVGRVLVMDLGIPRQLSEIHLCPRNDTNYIIPGNRYELFYWDQGWHSAGKKIAEDYFLEYGDVPSCTIYWLKCLTGGKEERIFTYENGKQIWW